MFCSIGTEKSSSLFTAPRTISAIRQGIALLESNHFGIGVFYVSGLIWNILEED